MENTINTTSLVIVSTPVNALVNAMIENRTNSRPLSIPKDAPKASKTAFASYKSMVNDIENRASDVVSTSISDIVSPDARTCYRNGLKKAISKFWEALRLPVSQASESDIDTIIAIVGDVRMDKLSGKRTFISAGDNSFRKKLEVIVAVRAEGETPQAREARETARIERNRAKREAEKAKKAASNQ